MPGISFLRSPHFSASAAVLCAAVLMPSAAQAQRLTGTVTEHITGQPVPHALVELLDANGRPVQRTVTSVAGLFLIEPADTGTFSIRAGRIGYAAVHTESIDVSPGTEHHFRVVMDAAAVVLDEISVTAEQTCRVRESAGDVLRVWTEARRALALASQAAAQRLVAYSGTSFTRRIGSDDLVMRTDTRPFARHYGRPYASLPPEDLHTHGYIRRAGTDYDYLAPDADVLLSPEFEDTYCFSLLTERSRPGVIGIRFAPASNAPRVPLIAGIAWLDVASSQLREIEFNYVNTEGILYADEASGGLEFTMLPSGAWVVSRWWIRTPLRARYTALNAQLGAGRVTEYLETGDEITVASSDGERWTLAERGRLTGTVFDSTAGRPLARAVVRLAGTSIETRSDADGSFSITDAPAGRYRLELLHPRLDSIPPFDIAQTANVAADTTTALTIAVPPLARTVAADCGTWPVRLDRSVVYGRVLDDAGTPIPDARITLNYDSLSVTSAAYGVQSRERTLSADARGSFRVCSMPGDRPVAVTITVGDLVFRRELWTSADPVTIWRVVVEPDGSRSH